MDDLPIKHKSEGVQHCSYGTCNSDTKYRHREDMKGVHKQVKQSPPKRKAPAKTKKDETKSTKSRTKCSTSNTPNASSTVVQKVKHSPPKRKASVTKDPPRKKAKEDETKSAKSRTKLSTSNTPNASSTVVQKVKQSPPKRKVLATKDTSGKKTKIDETKSAKSRTKLSSSNTPKASSTVVQKMTLYRLLRPDEDLADGLYAKNPKSWASVEQHVEKGSYGPGSNYISCCKTKLTLRYFRSKARNKDPIKAVKISINKKDVIDLTDPVTLNKHISLENKTARNYARTFKEVLVERSIPSNCIKDVFYL